VKDEPTSIQENDKIHLLMITYALIYPPEMKEQSAKPIICMILKITGKLEGCLSLAEELLEHFELSMNRIIIYIGKRAQKLHPKTSQPHFVRHAKQRCGKAHASLIAKTILMMPKAGILLWVTNWLHSLEYQTAKCITTRKNSSFR
jgi:hypothetical protein